MKKRMKTIEKFGKILLVLMFSFSQLSFPIEVLADELTQANETTMEMNNEEKEVQNDENDQKEETKVEEEEQENHDTTSDPASLTLNQDENNSEGEEKIDTGEKTPLVTINDISTNEYTLMSNDTNKLIRISYGYIDEMTTEEIDFSNKLYGDYEFEYNINSDEKEVKVTIHYVGNNDEILAKYLRNDISLEEGKIVILGSFDGIQKTDFLNRIDWESFMKDYNVVGYSTSIEEGVHLVADGNKLIIKTEQFEISYEIKVIGDYNQDGLVDIHDSLFIVDDILNTEDSKFNILDATKPVFSTGSWENDVVAHDELQNSFVNKTEIPVGEELVVKYYITGFQEDKLIGIEGNINYNKEILELMNVDVSTAFYGTVQENGHFAYLLTDYSSEGIFMTLTFKTLSSGEANISIDNILASLGVKANLDDSVSTTVTVFENGKGGDVEEENPIIKTTTTKTEEPVVTPAPVALNNTTNVTARTVKLSSDNLIKSLTIKGYDIKFDPNTLEYSLKVKNNVKSLNLEVVLNDAAASYEISGNQNFKIGVNTVVIKVTAEDGTERTYTLKVTREKAKTEEEQEEKKSSKTIIIILIILVIIGLIYVIFKDDEEDSKESKK